MEGNDSTSNQGKKTLPRIRSVILTKKIKTSNLVGKRLYFEILLHWRLLVTMLLSQDVQRPQDNSEPWRQLPYPSMPYDPNRTSQRRKNPKDTGSKYICNRCGKTYKATTSLSRHKRLECGVVPCEVCPICERRFKHRFVLNSHIIGCQRKLRHIIQKSGVLSKSEWISLNDYRSGSVGDSLLKERNYNDAYYYPCPVLDPNKKQPVQQQQQLQPQQLFTCALCGREYTWMYSLRRHQLQCGNKEARNKYGSDLMNEFEAFESKDIKLIPEMIRPPLASMQHYLCGECGKGYKWMANLRRHQRLECGKLPKHRCKICRREFYRRYELTNHYNTKHTIP
ncbi:hypothetical protein K0M31_008808 [Melipona bicolor]|uniref:C2H2-type domain-containing protein n=1 Tax=Melipona bicolor TaxID=60889 RepID=A0AA40FQJ1_9HYME|nr:hypothetical protein K0M31_008808 [Melipona bicolor]